MSESGQTRPFGDAGSMSGLPESGHGWAIYEYMPPANIRAVARSRSLTNLMVDRQFGGRPQFAGRLQIARDALRATGCLPVASAFFR